MLLKRIAREFDVSVVLARSMIRAAIFHFVFVGAVTALKSATNALYLARRDPGGLPWLYLGTAAIVALVTAWYGKRLGVMSAKHVLRRSLVGWPIVLVALAALAILDFGPIYGALYVAGEAFATALSVLFWSRLGEVFDARAAKRVFGALAAAGMAGATVGGLLVSGFAVAGIPAMVWCFLVPIVVFATRPLLGGAHTPGSIRRERITFKDGLGYAAKNRFPLGVAFLVLMFAVHAAAIDFAFRTGTHRFEGGREASMASLFGLLNAAVGVLSIAFQSGLTRRLLRRVGVFAYLSIVPALSVLSALWAVAVPSSFVPIFVMKVFEMMGSYSLNQTGLQLLYNPMPSAVRASVRAVIDGAVKKSGGALGGVVLLLVGSAMYASELLAVVVLLGAVLLIWIRLLRPRYVAALEEKLGETSDSPPATIDPSDRTTRQRLVRALEDDDANVALSAIAVLEGMPEFELSRHIAKLIAHPSEAVRLKAIELMQEAPSDDYVRFLVRVIEAPGKHPKAQAARALVMIDPVTARRVLEPCLRDGAGDRGLVSAAIVALLGSDREDEGRGGIAELAKQALEQMIATRTERPVSDRRELARLLGMLGPGPYAASLVTFFDDSSELVRATAIEAAGLAHDDALVPKLLACLGDRSVDRLVRGALASYGDRVVPRLAVVLDDRRVPVGARVQIPGILRTIGTRAAANAMLFSNRHDDAFLRHVIIEELYRMRRLDPQLEFDREQTHGAAIRRLHAFTYYRPFAADLSAANDDYPLLARAVRDRVRQNLQAALRLLGLIYDPKAMSSAYHGLERGDEASHVDGVELVDVALDGVPIRDEVLRHVEPRAPLGTAANARERARQLAEGRDVLLAMIAAESLARRGHEAPAVREPTSGEPLMPKSIVDRVFLLQNVQFFRKLSVDDLATVASICTEAHAEPRQLIYEEGQIGDSMYVIISGGIQLITRGRPLMDLHAGDSFGQTSVLDGGVRPVTAKASDEGVDYMRLDRRQLLDLMADRPELVAGLFVELGARIRELIERTQSSAGSE